ncbi:sulfonate ABC transporter [Paenibacillus marchantiophytorum]|uniref:Sulfonate ABC transporter n=1 Tax=Paenibacillus marchantiophytorum TaxID=1619310 RepID=A0ABQ1FIG5_9BACL|nr:ABC transporter permease subunit [Paenibacillus marchantiophytorum]GGA16488.1 sulfonate ABC transporter [Paenibacillus marchantiophytorum]
MKESKAKQRFFVIAPWIIPIAIIAAWHVLTTTGVLGANVLPQPIKVLSVFVAMLKSGELLTHITISARRAFSGLLLGGGIGFLLGLLNGFSRVAEKLADSSIQMIRTIPHLALIPLVIIWFGIDESAKLVLVSLGVFFPVYLNTFHGIRSIDPGLIEMGKVYGLNRLALYWHIILPGALPSILVGLRYALGIMWLTLIVAETVAAKSGLGYMANSAREFFQMDVIVLSILIYALLGKLSDSAAKWLEKWWLQWNPSYVRQ